MGRRPVAEDRSDPLAGLCEASLQALISGRAADPFALLGPHRIDGRWLVRAFLPGALAASLELDGDIRVPMAHAHPDGLFVGALPESGQAAAPAYRLRVRWPDAEHVAEDPYSFGLLLGDLDLHLLAEGRHLELGNCLGAQPMTIDGTAGVRFAVWAPNARRVSVVGDFNSWDGRRHPMRLRHHAGVWELFVPRLGVGERYQYELIGPHGGLLHPKADPVARATELPPATASRVADPAPFAWSDDAWLATRAQRQAANAPLSIYEVHAGSWLRDAGDGARSLRWDELADRLIPYVADMGFTHVEFMPIAEYPFGGSWGYQPLAQFAPSARLGEPAAFAGFVDRCHGAGIGVLVDWVPAHFPDDPHGLAQFDGTALYEHADPREGFHQDWQTLIYNLGRNEVANFLLASALEWLTRYHVDGIRVDAVASMLYRDYSRAPDAWVPNVHGGRENLESVAFLRRFNTVVAERCPGAATFAEESTAWPGVTAPTGDGGLGFDFKWNMGWMHDTLQYMSRDPIHRRYHHDEMTFGLIYAFSERFVLPLSHDEVVHGKGSLLGRMPGDRWQRFAGLRAYLGFMWAHPGKKLLFMGSEFGQDSEWNHDASPAWHLLDDADHRGVQRLVRDLNRCYRGLPALHARDAEADGFAWVVGDDRDNSVFVFLRRGGASDASGPVLVALNLTPVPRVGYRVGVPRPGRWREILNSDATCYGGSGIGNGGGVTAAPEPSHGLPASLSLTVPPLACVFLLPEE
ncbi:glycogen-branching enzyme [Burkholderia cepacia]|uniref:1,4-alpha-glucan branching enzyme GlgB n=1 Tax=Burkholderia cepacia TaxID=292 RepID=A0A1B4Q108_BURCE|nr:glycogen-branching enzyme [Burkholderia cepacia]